MNITLIRPPAYSVGLMGTQRVPYLGIAYIAAAAKAAGHSVDIIDMCGEDIDRTDVILGKYIAYGLSFQSLNDRLKPSKVIGFTCMFSQDWVFNCELIQYVHKLSPESIFVAGGEHISAIPDYCLKDCPELDICVIGEGEDIFTHLLSKIQNIDSWYEIKGIAFRGANGEIHRTPRAERINDINSLPIPAWDLTPMENYLSRGLTYHIQRGRTIPMLASRGCPYRCTFCSNNNMWGNPWMPRNPKLVVDEMEDYIRRYSAANFVFSDLTAVVRKDSIVELCNEILNRKLDITWQLPTLRTESINKETLQLMYEAGCRELDFAIESGSRKVLSSVKKGNMPEKMVSLIRDGLSVGMNLSINMVLGLPGEGYRDFLKSYIMAMKLAFIGLQEINAFPFIPYPGSRLFYDFIEKGKVRLEDRYFLDLFGYADLARAVSWSEKFSPRMLAFMRLFLMTSFYFLMLISHPGRIVRMITNAIRGVSTTKLEGVVKRVLKNIKIYYFRNKGYAKKNS